MANADGSSILAPQVSPEGICPDSLNLYMVVFDKPKTSTTSSALRDRSYESSFVMMLNPVNSPQCFGSA